MTTLDYDPSIRLKDKFPEFEPMWKRMVREVGPTLVDELKKIFTAQLSFVKDIVDFKLKLIIDNNFILGQILGAIRKNEKIENCFLSKILQMSCVEVFAPPKLREELADKIRLVLEEKDQALAFQYSEVLLKKIVFKDAFWIDEWKKANNLIGGTDKDDVPYLALALEVGGHAILSFDHVFHKQGDVKVWQFEDTDRIITNYNSGFISICILGNVSTLFAKLIATIFKVIRDLIVRGLKFVGTIIKGATSGLARIPWPVWLLLGGLIAVFWEDIKRTGKDIVTVVFDKLNELANVVKEIIRQIREVIKSIWSFIEPAMTLVFEVFGFLFREYFSLHEQINEMQKNSTLPKVKPKPRTQRTSTTKRKRSDIHRKPASGSVRQTSFQPTSKLAL